MLSKYQFIQLIMKHEFRFLEFEGVHIAAFIEGRNQNAHAGYHASNILFYVEQGELHIERKGVKHRFTAGTFCLLRKCTEAIFSKTWDKNLDCAIVSAMALQDEFIREAIVDLGLKKPKYEIKEDIISLGENSILKGLHNSLKTYIAENESPDKHLMYLKTKEAILGILKSKPEYLSLFYDFSKPVKVDLEAFMKHNITSALALDDLAKLSGRSLSTFNRDFRKIYRDSPHSWIMKQRLNLAKEILLSGERTSSEIYLELGFKDLAHFSRVFKKEIGVPPTQLKK